MTLADDYQTLDSSSPLRPGKDEMNFAEFPIALLTDRVPKNQKSIKFEDQIYDPKRKRLVTRRRIIDGSEEYGLPTATDDAVILALIQITKQKSNFTRREVEFTRLELLRLLGWADEGRNFERLKISLLRIANVTYNYENAWWDNRQKTWTTKAFHIIETVEINDSRGQSSLFPSRVVWNEVVFDSFQASFLRNIDFHLCMRLQHPTALRMYRFLGKRFHINPDWTFKLKEFAYDHIGLGRNYEGGTQIARKLQPAIEELEAVGFLEPLAESERFFKQGREWSIRFLQKFPAPALPLQVILPLSDASTAPSESPSPLIAELVRRGVTEATAAGLVGEHPAEAIAEKLDIFDWMEGKRDKRIATSPAGYLVDSIRKGYQTPKGFQSRAERARLAEAAMKRHQVEAAAREAERRQQLREEEETALIDAYWQELSSEEQEDTDAKALAEADPETLKLSTGPMKRLAKTLYRRSYIRKLLAASGQIPLSE